MKHHRKAEPVTGGPKHHQAAEPITVKRAPGASMATRPLPAQPGLSEQGQKILSELENQ